MCKCLGWIKAEFHSSRDDVAAIVRRKANEVFSGGDESGVELFRARAEVREFRRAVGVMIRKRDEIGDVGTGFNEARTEFFGASDAGETKYAPTGKVGAARHQLSAQHWELGRKACERTGSVRTDQDHGAGAAGGGGGWLAQRSGGDQAPVAEAGAAVDHQEAHVLHQVRVLESVIEDEVGGMVRQGGRLRAVTGDKGRGVGGQQQRFIAYIGGTVARGIHLQRAGELAAVTSRDKGRAVPLRQEEITDRERQDGLAGAPGAGIAAANHPGADAGSRPRKPVRGGGTVDRAERGE